MQNQKYIFISGTLLAVIVSAIFINAIMFSHDITISVSETKHKLNLSASFPDRDSKKVHDYIKSQLNMSDLTDMQSVEIKHYETPDYKMRFYIKSRNGSIRIVFDKDENTLAAYRKLKKTGEGLKKVLAN
jgi:hypothetical protein